MSVVAIDAETVAGLTDPKWKAAVTEMWEPHSDRYDVPRTMAALSPALCRIVSLGLVGVDSGREVVIYDSELCGTAEVPFQAVACDGESALMRELNRLLLAGKVDGLVTFKGRTFDVPAIIHGMAAHGIRPCGVLVKSFYSSRYRQNVHIDLWDIFTAYGAVMAPGGTTLRAWAWRYGLPDPKEHGSGADVAKLVEERNATRLLTYQLDDARTTAELYKAWRAVMEAPVSERASGVNP